MSVSSFDLIAQELQKQHQRMAQLKEENRELRQQLADLRSGRGIFIEIDGKRFALNAPTSIPAPVAAPVEMQQTTIISQELPPQVISEAPTIAITGVHPEALAMASNNRASNEIAEPKQDHIPEVPEASVASPDEAPVATPSFLEEAMIDEFAAAMTSPLAVWQGPVKKPEQSPEEQKASLRRELMGSYILE